MLKHFWAQEAVFALLGELTGHETMHFTHNRLQIISTVLQKSRAQLG